jgi:hypothetical protein
MDNPCQIHYSYLITWDQANSGEITRKYAKKIVIEHAHALVLIHLVLLARIVAQISTSISLPALRMCVLYHNFFFLHIFLLSPAELAWSQVIKSDRGCPVIEVSSF